MPSLWKKAKSRHQISQFVSDLQSRTKRRDSSLVVETGFPTSLIDLFVKNRDRLRKPSKKKRSETVADLSEPPPSVCPQSLTPTSLVGLAGSVCEIIEEPRRSIEADKEGIAAQEADLLRESIENDENREIKPVPNSSKKILFSVLKFVLVVILSLCTKKLVFGLSVAALSLLFIEFVGDRVAEFLRPCANAREGLKSFGEGIGVPKGTVVEKDNICDQKKKLKALLTDNEIQAADASSNPPRQPPSEKMLSFVEMEVKRLVSEEEERRDEVCRVKKDTFWKKLVPKKLSSRKKRSKKKESRSSSPDIEQEEQTVIHQEEELSRPPLKEETEEERVTKIEQLDLANDDEKKTRSFSGKFSRRYGSYKFSFMVMIMLLGLVRGRIVALVLTVMSCFMCRMMTGLVPPISIAR